MWNCTRTHGIVAAARPGLLACHRTPEPEHCLRRWQQVRAFMACVDGVVFAERRTPWDILQVRYIFISFSACCDGGRKKEELKLNKIKTAWKQIHTQWYNNWINLTRCSQKWNLWQQNIIERKLSQSDKKKKAAECVWAFYFSFWVCANYLFIRCRQRQQQRIQSVSDQYSVAKYDGRKKGRRWGEVLKLRMARKKCSYSVVWEFVVTVVDADCR